MAWESQVTIYFKTSPTGNQYYTFIWLSNYELQRIVDDWYINAYTLMNQYISINSEYVKLWSRYTLETTLSELLTDTWETDTIMLYRKSQEFIPAVSSYSVQNIYIWYAKVVDTYSYDFTDKTSVTELQNDWWIILRNSWTPTDQRQFNNWLHNLATDSSSVSKYGSIVREIDISDANKIIINENVTLTSWSRNWWISLGIIRNADTTGLNRYCIIALWETNTNYNSYYPVKNNVEYRMWDNNISWRLDVSVVLDLENKVMTCMVSWYQDRTTTLTDEDVEIIKENKYLMCWFDNVSATMHSMSYSIERIDVPHSDTIILSITDRTSSLKSRSLDLSQKPKKIQWVYTAEHTSWYSDLICWVWLTNKRIWFDHADWSNYSYYWTNRNCLELYNQKSESTKFLNALYQATGTWETIVTVSRDKISVKNWGTFTEIIPDVTAIQIIEDIFNDYTNIKFNYRWTYSNFTSDVEITVTY